MLKHSILKPGFVRCSKVRVCVNSLKQVNLPKKYICERTCICTRF